MKIETREDALLWCFTLWMDMARTGNGSKRDSLFWKAKGGDLEECNMNCPVCEFYEANDLSCGDECLLDWGGPDGCCDPESPYRKWSPSILIKDRKKWAKEIAILALEAL